MTEERSRFDLGGVIDRLHEGVQVISRDFRYLYVNEVAAAHGRHSAQGLIGQRMTELYPGIEATEMFGQLQRVIERGGSHRMEDEFAYPDGSKGWFELRMERVPEGAVILSLDITERKKADLNFRRAQRMDAVGQLAGGVAHDFNNLLMVVQNYTAFVLESLAESDPAREDLETVMTAARSAAELTRKLLGFARQLPVEPRQVSVGEAIGKLGHLIRKGIGEGIVLSLDVPGSVGAVRIDPSALDQVLLNLALNARDAMPSGGKLSISTSRIELTEEWAFSRGVPLQQGHYIVIAVADTGTGIPPELQERIFDPFFTTKGERGTGLGLATCWGLIQQAGGTISVYSEEEIGTTFKVYLPVQEQELPSVRVPPVPQPSAARSPKMVLVVDDEEAIRTLIGRTLRKAGYKLIEASSGAEALLLMEDIGDSVGLLLSDVVMPRMSGTDLVARVRARHPTLPILLMSGFAGPGASISAAQILSKPFSPSDLLTAVERALRDATGP